MKRVKLWGVLESSSFSRAEEARISVKEMTDEVAKEEFNTVNNIFDEHTADQVLPSFKGLHYLQICQYSKIFLSYKFVYE